MVINMKDKLEAL